MNFVDGTFTGLHWDEIQLLQAHLTGLTGQAVEIGCCDGCSTAHILEMSNLVLTSVDPFVPDSMVPTLIGSPERFAANTAQFGPRSVLLRTTSAEALKTWSTPLDFLFIDGDHNYDAVLFDLQSWKRWLKPGALMAMHDSRMSRPGGATFHPGPSAVADAFVYANTTEWEIVGEAFSMTLARKR
jgi:predicted O-methyltransferase YrrM